MGEVLDYVELLCKTHYSFLRGGSHPWEMVQTAVALGLKGVAVTDRDGVYGMPKAYWEAKKHPSLKFIVGAELTVRNRPGLTLISKNRKGYGNLCRIITAAHAGRPKGEPELDWNEFFSLNHEGLIALPLEQVDQEKGVWPQKDWDTLKELFEEELYLPICRKLDGRDHERAQRASDLSQRYGLKWVATNDVHYHVPNRRRLHDVLVCTREGRTLSNAGSLLFSNAESYLKSPRQMALLFREKPEVLRRTVQIAEECTFSPSELRYRYPSEWIPQEMTAMEYLERVVWEGAQRRYPVGIGEAVKKQLCHELKLIRELQFADYFLTIWDIVEFARSQKILCQGRGSAANSIVCFCLGITAIDPVRLNLLFERFISAERDEPPDIDVDFEHERREEVIQYVYKKYGRHRAAMVSAVIKYRSRSAVRDTCKAFGIDPEKLNTPHQEERDFRAGALESYGIRAEVNRLRKKLLDDQAKEIVEELKDFPRHLSIHSGGFTLSGDPIIETVPVEPARMEGRTIVQWDKYDLEIIGLLKVDLLSLGMLSAIRKCLNKVNRTLYEIPADDPQTYQMIQRADTVGVFQIESRAQMSMLGRLQPRTFYDLVIEVAIVRPGPIVGKMVHPYLKRRRGEEPIVYHHPKLQKILGKTLGVPLFQEQVMKMAIDLAGFTPGEADELRRAIGAWRSEGSIHRVGSRLMEGLLKSGVPQEFANRVFEQIKGFSEYGFPESHAASFALLAYASSYLKCHYPAEFTCAIMNSQPMGFYSNHSLIDDAKRHGVQVLPLHPNRSDWDCSVNEVGSIQLGWRVVKGLSEKSADQILKARCDRLFSSLEDFLERTSLQSRDIQSLAMGDVFRCFGYEQRDALWKALEYELISRSEQTQGMEQLNLFSNLVSAERSKRELFKKLDFDQSIREDYRSFRLSHRGHPMQGLRMKMGHRLPSATVKQVRKTPHGQSLSVAGLVIVRQRPPTAKGTSFATLEDEHGLLDLIIHKTVFEKYKEVFLTRSFLMASGLLQRDGHTVNLVVKRFAAI